MSSRALLGIASSIVIPTGTAIVLIHQANEGGAPASDHQASRLLWALAFFSLAAVSVLLGKATSLPLTAAAGVVILATSVGAILKAVDAPDASGATLVVTVAFVIMAAAAVHFERSAGPGKLAFAIAFWLLGAAMLADSTWNCAICAGARHCNILASSSRT